MVSVQTRLSHQRQQCCAQTDAPPPDKAATRAAVRGEAVRGRGKVIYGAEIFNSSARRLSWLWITRIPPMTQHFGNFCRQCCFLFFCFFPQRSLPKDKPVTLRQTLLSLLVCVRRTHRSVARLIFSDGGCDVWENSVNRSRCWPSFSRSHPWILKVFWILRFWYVKSEEAAVFASFCTSQSEETHLWLAIPK